MPNMNWPVIWCGSHYSAAGDMAVRDGGMMAGRHA